MSSIDKLSIEDYSQFALNKESEESYNRLHKLSNATDLRLPFEHAVVLDFTPKPEAMVGLFGLNQRRRVAYFQAPSSLNHTRTSFFEKFNIPEKDALDRQKTANINCSSSDPIEQKKRLEEKQKFQNLNDLKERLLDDYNLIMVGRYHFVQG